MSTDKYSKLVDSFHNFTQTATEEEKQELIENTLNKVLESEEPTVFHRIPENKDNA